MMRSTRWWRTRFFVFAAITTAFVAVMLVIVALASNTGSATPPSEDESAAQAALFVDPATVPVDYCMKLVQKYDYKVVKVNGTETPVFTVGATKNVPPRLWSDAVNTPLKPISRKAEMAVICHDPAQAAMVMNRLGPIQIGSKTIAEVNASWIQAQGDTTEIAKWAQACLTNDVETHMNCAKTMAYTAYLLGKFHSAGVHEGTSTWNIHLVNGATVGSVPEFGLNPKQETGQWLVLDYTSKTGGICLKVGFNVGTKKVNGGDQRLAGLPCKTTAPPTTAPPTTAPPTTAPPTTAPPTTAPPTTAPPTTAPPTTAPPTTAPPSGKHQSDAPTPDASIVPAPSGGYVDRTGAPQKAYTPPPAATTDAGHRDSGEGAVSTTTPPATSSPAAEVSITTAPTTAPAMP